MKEICHKLAARNNVLVALASMIFSVQASADCSRDDVTFYLDKGFSTEQITTMCSASSTTTGSDALQPGTGSEHQGSEQHSSALAVGGNALFLQRAIKAQKINLGSDSLNYTQKICIQYGEEDLYGFTPKTCPNVRFMISLNDLKVLDTGKKYYFYGTSEVRVKSSAIKREIIGQLKDKKPEERELILEKFEKGDETVIPIREDFSMEKVKQVLQELSK